MIIMKVVSEPDTIRLSPKSRFGKPVIEFEKTINGRVNVITYTSDKHHDLLVQTMYASKKSLSTPTDEQASVNTPEASSGTALADTVPQNTINGNDPSGQNGETRKSLSGQTDTPQFKAWFGKSKIVDPDGDPLVVYHATDADFTVFNTDHRGAIWATARQQSIYARDRRKSLAMYARIEDPYILEVGSNDAWDIDDAVRKAKLGGHDGLVVRFKFVAADNDYYQFVLARYPNDEASDVLRSMTNASSTDALPGETLADFDSRMKETGNIVEQYIAVWDPSQFKSATDNIGTFSRDDPDMRFSLSSDAYSQVYDADGSIPLSERFNAADEDIRYSLGGDYERYGSRVTLRRIRSTDC